MAKSTKLKVVPQERPVFNPQESYVWKADDVFAITGIQLDVLNRAVQSYLNTPETQKALYLVEGAKVLQALIKEGVEEGIMQVAPKADTK